MTPTNRNPALRVITSTTALALLLAIVVYVGILISSAGQLSHAPVPATVRGPLGLFELQKQSAPNGAYQASISLLPATWAYLGFWVLATAAAIWARLRRKPTPGDQGSV